MYLKRCSKCGKNKPLSDFYCRKIGPRQGKYYEKCKVCMKVRGRSYYHNHHTRQLKLAKQRNRRYLDLNLEYLAVVKNNKCADCGKFYPPWVMDFDYKDKTLKSNNVAWLRRFHSQSKLKQEIDKYDLVCANCHRLRTFENIKSNYKKIILKLSKEGHKFYWKNLPR